MYQLAQDLLRSNEQITLILNNGFERRAARSAQVLHEIGLRPLQTVLIRYPGKENEQNYRRVSALIKRMCPARHGEIDARDIDSLMPVLAELDVERDRVVCDITGLSRYLMLSVLTRIYKQRTKLSLIYTEAREYYPRKQYFRSFLQLRDPSEAFKELTYYEKAEIVYSSNCEIQEVRELPGRIFPNHPVLLVAFLAFKRSRLSCILNQYETNARILVQSVPVRDDLKWREKALEIINFDLIDENKNGVVKLSTLDWRQTYDCLTQLYLKDNARYRFNVLLAPLGSKMQTVGAWYFAIRNPDVKVIVSAPRKHFAGKYSVHYTGTHLIPMDSVYDERGGE